MDGQVRVALVGLGGMGVTHYRNYQQLAGARVVGVVGKTEKDRQTAAEWGLPMAESLAALCAREAVDMVDICVPTFMHRQLAEEAAALGKHVLVEKPVALSLGDARAMYDAADRAGVQLYVAQVLRFTRETEALRAAVADGRFGRPLDACFERLSACPAWTQGGWLFDRAKSGLLPFDLHIHDLDLIVSLFGKPDTVSYTSAGREGLSYREQYRITYGYQNGLTISAEASWLNAAIPFTARWRVYFERGMLIFDGASLTAYGADGTVEPIDIKDEFTVDCGANLPPCAWFYRELEHFTRCAAENRPSERVTREQVLSVLEIVEGIQ